MLEFQRRAGGFSRTPAKEDNRMSEAQRNYKDTVFRMLFKEPENLLALYNAVNKTNYTNVEDLKITTLENAVWMNAVSYTHLTLPTMAVV